MSQKSSVSKSPHPVSQLLTGNTEAMLDNAMLKDIAAKKW